MNKKRSTTQPSLLRRAGDFIRAHERRIIIAISVILLAALALSVLLNGRLNPFAPDRAALVNGEAITIAQLDARYRLLLSEEPGLTPEEGDQAAIDELRDSILDQMIDEVLVAQESAREGITVDKAEIDTRFDEMITAGMYPGIDANTPGADDLLAAIRHQITVALQSRALLKKLVPDESVTDADVTAWLTNQEVEADSSTTQWGRQSLLDQRRTDAWFALLDRLREEAEIEIPGRDAQ